MAAKTMRRRGGGRRLVVLAFLYAFVLQTILALTLPIRVDAADVDAAGSLVLCAEHEAGADDPGQATQPAPVCKHCVACVPSVLGPPHQADILAIVITGSEALRTARASEPALFGRAQAFSARGPPA